MPETGLRHAQTPTQLGRYQVLGMLATGGMAEILLGRLTGPAGFERPVVLKRILPHLARQEEFRTMFLDEARLVARIRHENVVQVHELGRDAGELFLVMEYLEGESVANVAKRLRREGRPIPHHLAAHICAEAAAGLHAAHELRDDDGRPLHVVHRDVSPQNLMVTYDGAVKVLDFGIVKATAQSSVTQSGVLKGKFRYMAPEQCRGEALDRRTDIFALGVVLYEISTATKLFQRPSELAIVRAICDEEIPTPSARLEGYPPMLEAVVMRALARHPADRYQTADEMRRDLIAVVRALDPQGIPGDALGELVSGLFTERVREKRELLRRVRSGSSVTHVPEADIDIRSQPTVAGDAPTPRSGRWRTLAAIFAVLSAVAVAGVLALTIADEEADRGDAPPAPSSTSVAEDTPAEPLPQPAPPAEPTPEVAPAEVDVSVITTPAGATVYLDGRPVEQTPSVLTLPRSDAPVRLRVELDRHAPVERELVADVDQRIELALTRVREARRRAMSRMSKRPPEPGDEFFRFD